MGRIHPPIVRLILLMLDTTCSVGRRQSWVRRSSRTAGVCSSETSLYLLFTLEVFNATGAVCLSTFSRMWSPALMLTKVLPSISLELTDTNPSDSLGPEIPQPLLKDMSKHGTLDWDSVLLLFCKVATGHCCFASCHRMVSCLFPWISRPGGR